VFHGNILMTARPRAIMGTAIAMCMPVHVLRSSLQIAKHLRQPCALGDKTVFDSFTGPTSSSRACVPVKVLECIQGAHDKTHNKLACICKACAPKLVGFLGA
jgi:hypothetical protein